MMISPWDGGTRLFERSLDVRSGIQETIASNMANEETPGYKSRILPFHETFNAVLRGDGPLESVVTDPKHVRTGSEDSRIFQHTIKQDAGAGLDENTVNLEKEMTLMAENTLMYMAVSQFLKGRFDGWNAAIDGGSGGR
ncbi:MAG: flagellar basal body rod protein FlgB [Nitrospirales bacterium]|nr:flagellar basal body rod protein FlgB [Nitrospirales bacterium]